MIISIKLNNFIVSLSIAFWIILKRYLVSFLTVYNVVFGPFIAVYWYGTNSTLLLYCNMHVWIYTHTCTNNSNWSNSFTYNLYARTMLQNGPHVNIIIMDRVLVGGSAYKQNNTTTIPRTLGALLSPTDRHNSPETCNRNGTL